jgi:Immunity protein 22
MSSQGNECRRSGFVSVWVGTFPSVEAAETYFGIPDEIGVYLPPEVFIRDLGLEDLPTENLEVNFEQVSPRPLRPLLADATFATSFLDQAVEAARGQGIEAAHGVALLYDFDYQAKPGWQRTAGPLTFIGSFPFRGAKAAEKAEPVQDPRIQIRDITDNVL